MNPSPGLSQIRAMGFFIVAAIICLCPPSGQSAELKVAIMDFESVMAPARLGLAISEILRTELGQIRNITFIERKMIDQVLEEQKLQQSGLIKLDDVVKAGNLMGAEFVIVGSVVETGTTYTINCRCVDVQSGVVKAARTVSGQGADQIPEMVKQLSGDIGKVLPAAKPFIFSFEDQSEAIGWLRNYDDKNVGISRVARHATQGKHSLKIDLPHTEYPGIHSRGFPKDWEQYDIFSADVYYDDRGAGQVTLVIRIDDSRSKSFDDRFHASFILNKGQNTIQVPLEKVKEKLDCSAIYDVFIFLNEPKGPATLYLDNIRLAR